VKKVGAGKPTILTHAEEEEIVYCCQVLQEIGFGLTKEVVSAVVIDYLQTKKREHPFANGQPGWDWWNGFQKRWPKLVSRKSQHLPKNRATAANPVNIAGFYTNVEELYKKLELSKFPDMASRIWNCDETCFNTSVGSQQVLAKRGSRWVPETGGGSGKESITVHICGSAAGEVLPPYIVYKGKHLYTSWTNHGPPGARYSTSPSGWMEKDNFQSWMQKLFIPRVKPYLESGPVVLFFNGHHSHLSVELVKTCKENNVWLYCLPPNTTHVLQPLDVGVFGATKAAWRSIVKTYKVQTRAACISKEVFPSLLNTLCSKGFKASHFQSAFRECGLYPLCKSAIASYKLAPSMPFDMASSSSSKQVSAETPLRTELRHFFADHLRPKGKQTPTRRRRIKIHHFGEALTQDEVLQRMQDAEAEKIAKRPEKTSTSKLTQRKAGVSKKTGKCAPQLQTTVGSRSVKSKPKAIILEESDEENDAEAESEDEKDIEHCFSCGQLFNDDGECLGCDSCWRWFHYSCVGFDHLPEENDQYICHICTC
jgi:hypothetical protein